MSLILHELKNGLSSAPSGMNLRREQLCSPFAPPDDIGTSGCLHWQPETMC